MTPPPMITALPEVLKPLVGPIAERVSKECDIAPEKAWDAVIVSVLGILNAALDAGVAREAEMSAGRFGWVAHTEKGHFVGQPLHGLLIRTGDT